MEISVKLIVLFSDPFWIGIFEKYEKDVYSVCKVTFGSEPKDEEVYNLLLLKYDSLKFSNEVIDKDNKIMNKIENPKRLQRKIKKEVNNNEIGTKAQIALKKQYEENKLLRKKSRKEKKQEIEERNFELRQIKKKKKHKGH